MTGEEKRLITAMGKRISEKRRQQNLTQDELAEIAELNTQQISNAERGAKSPRIMTVYKISKALNVSVDYFLTGHIEVNNISDKSSKLMDLTDDFIKKYNSIREKE